MSSSAAPPPPNNTTESPATDEAAAKSVQKRYEGLVMVRTKAIRGKGAWYWHHLEPILVHNSDTGLPKAVKLRCSLCEAVFSASNPSRTASEHLKRGTCPNFNSLPSKSEHSPSNFASQALTTTTISPQNHRKRNSSGARAVAAPPAVQPLAVVDPYHSPVVTLASTSIVSSSNVVSSSNIAAIATPPHPVVCLYSHSHSHSHNHLQQNQNQLVLSGGKEDLGALAMLEDSVKRLKSPKTSPTPTLTMTKVQIDTALDCLAEWAYECCGSVSISSLEHPKFKHFLNQVGLPGVNRRDFVGSRLDVKYEESKAESESKIREAMFFQVACDGWKVKESGGEDSFVHLGVNLPNGTCVFRKAVFTSGYVPSKYAEDVLWDTITEICGNAVQQCVGVVSDKFKGSALRNLESQHHWMVNLSCQYQGFISLVKDFGKEVPLFSNVTQNCFKLANFVNNKSQIRHSLHKYQLQEYGHANLLRVPFWHGSDFSPVYTLVEDILSSSRALKLVLLDESYKAVAVEEPIAREIEEMMGNLHFWNELEAVHSLVKLIKSMSQEIEAEKPRVGQCLPLWEELRVKVMDWCSKFHIVEGNVQKVIEKRFKKNYHPAWAAAFVLDPLYLSRDTSGKYLPPFKCLTPEQEKDVDKLITRLVSREEAHIALMELMKWRTEGLDSVYAQAVQLKRRDPGTGKMKIVNPLGSRLVWETYLTEFKLLGKVAVRLIFLQATSCGFKCNSSLLKGIGAQPHSRVAMERAQKMIFISANSKMEKREVSGDDEKDAELFTLENGEDDVLNEVFVDTSSVSI